MSGSLFKQGLICDFYGNVGFFSTLLTVALLIVDNLGNPADSAFSVYGFVNLTYVRFLPNSQGLTAFDMQY